MGRSIHSPTLGELPHPLKGLWQADDEATFQQVRTIISKTLAHHHSDASLLHGDLWGGNDMFTADGQPALIDPAAVYGDREPISG